MKPRSKALLGQLADVDLRLLRVFIAVVDCGGISAAELELDIAMSTLSRHLKDLEERLGLTLCRRGRSGFALTQEGERIYAAARQLTAAAAAFRTELHEVHERLLGSLHIAFFENTAANPRCRLAQALAAFGELAPEVRLHLHVGTIAAIERGVIDGVFHLGILPEHKRSESLAYDALFDETMLLYAGIGHPWFAQTQQHFDWEDLRQQRLAGLDCHSPNYLLAQSRQLSRQALASNQEGVAALVMSGAHLGFLPEHYAEPLQLAGRLNPVSTQNLRYECQFSCITRKSPSPSRVSELFRQLLLRAHQRCSSDAPFGTFP